MRSRAPPLPIFGVVGYTDLQFLQAGVSVMADIFDKLQPIVERYRVIETEMAQPEVAADYARLGELNRERSGLEDLVGIDVERRSLAEEQADLRALIAEGGDPELVEMAQLELEDVETRLSGLAQRLRIALLPKDPNDERDVIVEIHAAAGGQEASLFASDLYRMYQRYAQEQGWSVDILDSNPVRPGRLQPHRLLRRWAQRLQQAEVRGRRPSRPARPRNRGPGPHPHFNCHRGCVAPGR